MNTIKLTKGVFALVDDDEFERLNKHKWYASKEGSTFYARRKIRVDGKQRTIFMHKEVVGVEVGFYVDHINRNGIDNRKCNLRKCTSQQNSMNRSAQKNNTSGYKGVLLHPQGWVARIGVNGKKEHLGYFETKQMAATAYNKRAKQIFGKFAFLNDV